MPAPPHRRPPRTIDLSHRDGTISGHVVSNSPVGGAGRTQRLHGHHLRRCRGRNAPATTLGLVRPGRADSRAELHQAGLGSDHRRCAEQEPRYRETGARIAPQTAVLRADAPAWKWEINVLDSPQLNALYLPGGKIVFYTGLIEQLKLRGA